MKWLKKDCGDWLWLTKELQGSSFPQENTENNLMFLGLVGMMDPQGKKS